MSAQRPDPEGFVLLGACGGAFGVKGEIRVRSFTEDPAALFAYGPLYGADGKPLLTPKRWRPLNDGFALTAEEVKTREEAEKLRNARLYVPRAVLPPAEEEEFYHVDLIGCRVEALDGAILGVVLAVQNFGADDLLDIRTPEGKQLLLPFTKAAAPIVDVAAKRIVADPPEGEGEPEPGELDKAD